MKIDEFGTFILECPFINNIMETKILNRYASYNSVILEGKRVRRMRRTELSAEKIIT